MTIRTSKQTLTSDTQSVIQLKQYIIDTIIKTHTTHRDRLSIERYLDRNINIIIEDLHAVYTSTRTDSTYTDGKFMMKSNYRSRWGQLTLSKKSELASLILIDMLTCERLRGFTGCPTIVEFNNQYLVKVLEDYNKIFKPDPVIVTAPDFVMTKVNRASLQAFATTTTNTKLSASAKKIIASLDKDDYLKQAIKMPIEDRTYLIGLNLQTAKKELRAAALSGQWQYDVNCAVYGLFASVAHEITQQPCPVLQDYIKNRASIRTSISNQTGLSIDQVKQVLTSVGFGSQSRGSNNLAVVLTTLEGKAIVEEFRKASRIIYKHYAPKEKTQSRGQLLSSLFRQWESSLMSEFVNQSAQKCNLPVHDAVIMLRPFNYAQATSMMTLDFTTHHEYFEFEEKRL